MEVPFISMRRCKVHVGTGATAPPGALRQTPRSPSAVGPRLDLFVNSKPLLNKNFISITEEINQIRGKATKKGHAEGKKYLLIWQQSLCQQPARMGHPTLQVKGSQTSDMIY